MNVEFWFAFVLVPIYLASAFLLSRTGPMRGMRAPLAFTINWALAATCLGIYAATTGLANGNWVGVGVFSGTLAATLATLLSTTFPATVRSR